MIIVLEGPDGVGKSTLCRAIMEQYTDGRAITIGHGPPEKGVNPFDVYLESLDRISDLSKEYGLVVVDRLHVGELVYGNILRTTTFSESEAAVIDMKLAQMGATMVYCALPVEDARLRLLDRDGTSLDPLSGSGVKHLPKIIEKYEQLFGTRMLLTEHHKAPLPGPWESLWMTLRPQVLARKCLASAGWVARFAKPNFVGRPLQVGAVVIVVNEFNPCQAAHILETVSRGDDHASRLVFVAVNNFNEDHYSPNDIRSELVVAASNSLKEFCERVLRKSCVCVPTSADQHKKHDPTWAMKLKAAVLQCRSS